MFKRTVHPGQILKDELDALGITSTAFAHQIDVSANWVSQIIEGNRSITGDTAHRFAHWFAVEPQFWLNLQSQFNLATADQQVGEMIRGLPTNTRLPPPHGRPRLD